MNIIEASMKHRQIALVLTLLLVIVGYYSLNHMARREDPKMTIRQGLIIMAYPGATVEQVDTHVTKKVEQFLFRFDEVKKDETESTSSDGLSMTKVELQGWVKNRDKFWSKVTLGLRELMNTDFPQGVYGPIINSDFGDTIALLISVESDRRSYTELKNYIEIIEDELRPLAEVSKLKRYGEQKEQIYITGSTQKFSQYRVSLSQVIKALTTRNSITPSGEIKTRHQEIPIHATNLYNSEQQLKQQQVYVSPQGEVVRLGDLAEVERRYEEPDSFIRVNGNKVLMLSVEMQADYNIVEFGEKVDQMLKVSKKKLPPDVKIKTIVNQPEVVNTSILHFLHEFLIAIIAVILVMVLLLPLRIAMVAAFAIPVSIMITFAFLDAINVELQQMTLAGLIVVLGMVVDNAIVIVDDYVEKLDHGMTPWDAGWKSATELFMPVFSATIAIMCAFLPVAFIISGNAGEFLLTLPIAVTVALLVSLFVAVFLTPFFCYVFIKIGLAEKKNSDKKSFLDRLQEFYDAILTKAFAYPKTTVLIGILTIASTVFLMSQLQIRMFPNIERNQFCLEVYMTQGTNLEETDRAIKKIEAILQKEKRITDVASFVGCSSPRFYLTYAPKAPDKNYAQILINTISAEATQELVDEYLVQFDNFCPDGEILVKQLQQGPPVEAPIEVRVIGNNTADIKRIAEQVEDLLKNTRGTNFIRTTFKEDYYGISVQINEEVANRMGFTNQEIAQLLAVGFKGYPVSTYWEGDNAIDIFLRLKKENMQDFDDINNMYITSPANGARIPLRQIATLVPEWQSGKITRRNGVRTITVRSEAQMDRMPNDILKEIMPKIEKIQLPAGVKIGYGGEIEDQKTVMAEFAASLLTSLVCIFFVLLFQFKTTKKAVIIMLTIPLSWFGAILGLYVTGNPFSFTGFLGVIGLSGLVVRNGIILVDYAEQLKNKRDFNSDLKQIAMDAGKRRMRPVFLTATAAAAGVVPMIISGSPLWAPMGSVLSVGLIFSMVLTLFIMPVLYWLAIKNEKTGETVDNNKASCLSKVAEFSEA